MAPFSEHLGLPPEEFGRLKPIFSSAKSKVLLVEGTIDKEYFEFFQSNQIAGEYLSKDIEVVPYGGKDTLKNTLLVQFVLRKFDRVFITYDADADSEIRNPLGRLGLKPDNDFLPLGISQAGKDCIEGLLPKKVLDAVNGRETDLVMKLGSRDNNERKKAKDALKKSYLTEFKASTDHQKDELKDLVKAIKVINARLSDRG